MKSLRASVVRFILDEDGPTSVEYAVMLAMILLGCILTIQTLGNSTNTMYSSFNQNSGLGNGS